MALILPIMRADFRMAVEYTYLPRPRLPVPITVYAGREDEFDAVEQYEDWFNDSSIHSALHWFEGGHFFIHSAADHVMRTLRATLARGAHGAPLQSCPA
jgi:medium-chain acyl-[acyl-carrier-protein] hydrolase